MPVKETVTIEVEATGDGLRKIATDAKHANKALKKTSDVSKKTGSTFAENAELAERMRAALGPLGDVLGDVTGGADDFATALQGFSAKQVAAAAGAVAVAAGLAKTGAAVIDVIANLEQYEDQIQRLQEAGDLTAGQVEGLREASAAVTALSESFSDLVLMIAADVAPVIEDFSRGVVALRGFFEGGFEGMNKAAQKFNRRQREIKAEQDQARKETGASEEAATKEHEARADRRIAASNRVLQAEREAQALVEATLMAEAGPIEQIILGYEDRIQKTFELEEAHAHLAGQMQETRESFIKQRDAEVYAYLSEEINTALIPAFREVQKEVEQTELSITEGLFQATDNALDKVGDSMDEMGKKSRKTFTEVMEIVNAYSQAFGAQIKTLLGAIEDLYNDSIQAQIDATEKGSEREKQLMREQFKKNKEFAIAQAAINMSLGIVNAFTAPWPVNLVMAALVAATGAVQIGLIASKKNPYHRGGIEQLAPDERVSDSGQSITRNNEVSMHVTRQGQRTLADHLNDMNRGPRGAGNRGPMVLVVDGRPIRNAVYEMGEADPRYGVASRRSS
jgi:hypothetical protein